MPYKAKISDQSTAKQHYVQLIIGLCLLVFFNISLFTIITSFTKSNFLTAVQVSPLFKEVYNQKPYFFLYGLSGICFIVFYLVYHMLSPKATFEHRIKRDMLSLIGCSLLLYLIPTLFPGFQEKFLPAAIYFVIYDILDDLIIIQTWTLINYCINIRESKKIQNLFLFSGGVAAFISGRYIVGLVPQDSQTFFLILVMAFSVVSFFIVTYIFSFHRSRILATISAERISLKSLFNSQRKYKVIKSIIYITILIGVFNLFFKVLFDTQVNARYPIHSTGTEAVVKNSGIQTFPISSDSPDPKTEFIGKYKAYVSFFQVALQLLFIYFFAKLWLSGRILYSYPLLLIPNLVFILWVYFTRAPGYENLLFWGTVFACGVNELIRRVIFDSAYQLLMFSIPERLCNALRMYSRLFIKPVVIICICFVFVIIPAQTSPIPLYCLLLIALLITMVFVVSRIPGDYVSSLKKSVLRRVPLERAFDSLVSLEANFVVEQYRQVVAESSDRFGYLYILNIIRNNYSPDLNFILAKLLENADREVRLEAVSIVGELGVFKLIANVESLQSRETDLQIREACLKVMVELGPSNEDVVHELMGMDLSAKLRKYVLAIAYRNGSSELKETVTNEVGSLLRSSEQEEVLAGIWLVGELGLSHLRSGLEGHFGLDHPKAFGVIIGAATQIRDFELLNAYIKHIGYDQIRDYETLNKNLALFGKKSFQIISEMINSIIESKTYFELEKCLHTLQFIPSQDSLDFLVNILLDFNIPLVRKEALNCAAKIKKANPNLDYDLFIDKLPGEIDRCKEYCRYFKAIMSWNHDSLLLIELARNIEHRVWTIFKIMDMFYPDLAIFDSYYRITQTSKGQVSARYVKAKSIEYLESLIKDEHSEFLHLLESIVFEDGFFFDVDSLPGPPLKIEDVYEHVLTHSYHWLRVSAILDMPPGIQKRFDPISKETEDMIPVLERIHFLRKVSLFKGFSIMEMMMLAQITQDVKFEAGHVLFEIGDPGDALYIILEGRINIVNEKGRVLNTLHPPQCFGEIAVLDKAGRAATAICVDDTRMLTIANNDFQEILEKYPILYKNIVYILTTWLREDKTRSSGAPSS